LFEIESRKFLIMPQVAFLLVLILAAPIVFGLRIKSKGEEDRKVQPSVQRAASHVSDASDIAAEPSTQRHVSGSSSASKLSAAARPTLLVVGSLNLDIIIEIDRLPAKGETVVARKSNAETALGGKGANQAIAAARLGATDGPICEFVCNFGNDAHAQRMERILAAAGLRLDACEHTEASASGQGIAMLQDGGAVSAIVLGGSNDDWTDERARALAGRVRGASALLLQREIPESVNTILAAVAHEAGVPVVYDVGGADRPMPDALLKLITYICPNETELKRLTSMPTGSRAEVIAAAKSLQARGAANVLVTLGADGSLLLRADGTLIEQAAVPIPGGKMIDATGAGDAFRAAFAIALVEGRTIAEGMRFGAAAGAIAVSRFGAEPSLPTRAEVEALLAGKPLPARATPAQPATALHTPPALRQTKRPPPPLHGDFSETSWAASARGECPLSFGSRLNSMKDRPELWNGPLDVLGLIARQGHVEGLGLVDFNFPQHLRSLQPEQVTGALAKAKLKAGAICMRYEKEHQLGALTHPDPTLRRKAIELTKEGARWAQLLGANELVIWSAFDGYDYPPRRACKCSSRRAHPFPTGTITRIRWTTARCGRGSSRRSVRSATRSRRCVSRSSGRAPTRIRACSPCPRRAPRCCSHRRSTVPILG
jgi:ribokinase